MSKQKPTDIWGFAMIMLHVYSGKRPWPGLNEERIAKLTLEGCRPQYPGSDAFHRGLDFIRWRIAQDCWQHIPSHRPTAAEILHIWNDPHSRQVGSNLVPELIGDSGSGLLDMTRCTKYYLSVSPTLSPGYESITAECRAHPNASGCVYVDLVRPSGQASVDKSGWYQPFRDEVARWRRLRHENLLPLFGVCFVKELQQWHAVVPRYDPFEDWHEGVVRRRKHLSKTLAPWLKLILDVANALNFLHMQVPPITHGDLILDNVYIPHWMTSAVETPTTVHACLGGFRTVSINENTSQDVKAWAELARTVSHQL
ncbi:hypothetical protein BKA62DRAFT_624577 [Auriculariales sp. MPI-PUGE-AT-0066]|nr:hypothetical protein BKA62DRAFT_624577 [Auriculariales sp. MPI-PUGE-AT-0066]